MGHTDPYKMSSCLQHCSNSTSSPTLLSPCPKAQVTDLHYLLRKKKKTAPEFQFSFSKDMPEGNKQLCWDVRQGSFLLEDLLAPTLHTSNLQYSRKKKKPKKQRSALIHRAGLVGHQLWVMSREVLWCRVPVFANLNPPLLKQKKGRSGAKPRKVI